MSQAEFDSWIRRSAGVALFAAGFLLASSTAQAQWTITTVAGNGNAALSGDNGPATAASLNHPRGPAFDSTGAMYIADTDNHRVRKVVGGTITTVAGNGGVGASGDGGPATGASLSDAFGVAVDGSGNLYIADASNHRVRKVTPGGIITTIAGTGQQGFAGDGGPATAALLNRPTALAFDGAGNLYIADSSNQRIRKVTPGGTISTFAGNGSAAYSGDNGPAVAAALMFPLGLSADRGGNIYIADAGNNCIRKVLTTGAIITVAGRCGVAGSTGDAGPATAASLNLSSDVLVDGANNIYIADSGNNRIRKVDAGGTITTIAGTGGDGFVGDNGPATSATLSYPWGLGNDTTGIYIADRVNNRIRKISNGTTIPLGTTFGAPRAISASPGTGSGGAQLMTFTFSDGDGVQDLDVVNVLINNALNGISACYLAYSRPTNTLYLVSDAGGGLLPGITPGSGIVSNSQCTLNGAGSSVTTSGNNLILNLNLSFTAAFGGNKAVYLAARDLAGGNSNWQALGSWTVPGAAAANPAVISLAPARSEGSGPVTFTVTVSDTAGAQDLGVVNILINDFLNGNQACYLAYSRAANTTYLVGDAGGILVGGLAAGTTGSVSNSQCTLTATGATIAGNNITVTATLNFASAFAGNRLVYVAARTNGDTASSGWQVMGTRSIQ